MRLNVWLPTARNGPQNAHSQNEINITTMLLATCPQRCSTRPPLCSTTVQRCSIRCSTYCSVLVQGHSRHAVRLDGHDARFNHHDAQITQSVKNALKIEQRQLDQEHSLGDLNHSRMTCHDRLVELDERQQHFVPAIDGAVLCSLNPPRSIWYSRSPSALC